MVSERAGRCLPRIPEEKPENTGKLPKESSSGSLGGFGIRALPLGMVLWDVPAQLTLACGTGNPEPLFLFPEPGIPSLDAEQRERIFPLICAGKKGWEGRFVSFFFFLSSFNSCCVNLSYSFVFSL